MAVSKDIIDILEAAYRVELDGQPWIEGVLDAALPHMMRGSGVAAYEYDASDVSRMRVTHVAHHGMPEPMSTQGFVQVIETADAEYVRNTWRSLPCALASATPGVERQPGWAAVRAVGVVDILAINGVDPSGIGCWVGALLPKPLRLGEKMRLKWGRVAAHLAAGLRLRRRLAAGRKERIDLTSGADAILEPGGKVQHAEGEATDADARRALHDAAVALERARGSLRRRDPDEAVAEWKGLIEVRWSLVDHFESDGRRYLVARRNEPEAAPFDRLSARERQVVSYASFGHSNKLIAYELGISHATVRVLMARAATKLGVKTRDELARLVAASLEKAGKGG